MAQQTAAGYADGRVARVLDDPHARVRLLCELYRVPKAVDRGYLPYRRAASAFMNWQLRRGLLDPGVGSPWWRAVNAALLTDTSEARALAFGYPGTPRSPAVAATLAFIRQPSARTWYRAHNMSVASAYLANEQFAREEGRVERFFLNLVLVRVLYAHALVTRPRLALGWLAPLGRVLGDPRLGMTGIFLSLSRILPAQYPLGNDVWTYASAEHSFGHLVDVGMIVPRLPQLYDWSAAELELPALRSLLHDGPTPAYAWDRHEADVWDPAPSRLARAARRAVSASRG